VRFWDGTSWTKGLTPSFTLVLKHPGALRSMFLSASELSLGEAYIYDEFDIEGDIESAIELGDFLLAQENGFAKNLHLASMLGKLPAVGRPRLVSRLGKLRGGLHSKDRDRQAISYHYDLPPEFYALFLDRKMIYSCAYFESQDDDLDTAQEHKLDYLCRKLRLKPGERLLDIGCGWGGLVLHAATRYGVNALGITLSTAQADYAGERIREAGVEDRCRVELCDYRERGGTDSFDKIVSVGMVEHVGEAKLPEYFSQAWHLLRPGGVFLNHGIAQSAVYHRSGPSFIDKYVFPDGDLVPINTMLGFAEKTGFEVRDVESLREHYVLTLHHWVKRLEAHAEQASRITDQVTYRIWRLYMAGTAHSFAAGRTNVYQSLLAKPVRGRTNLPLTRDDWYRMNRAGGSGIKYVAG
jgi:cyclopropane-fatty-acyl-phospholipid synthase